MAFGAFFMRVFHNDTLLRIQFWVGNFVFISNLHINEKNNTNILSTKIRNQLGIRTPFWRLALRGFILALLFHLLNYT